MAQQQQDESNYGQVGEPSVSGQGANAPAGQSYPDASLDQLIGDVLPGWRRAGNAQPFEETELATTVSGAQKQQPTGRWKIAVTNGQYTRDIVLNRELSTDKGTQWSIAESPKDLPSGTTTRPPSATGQLDRIDANGKLIPPGDTTTKAAKLRDPATGAVTDLPDPKTSPEGTLKEFGNQLLNIKPDGTYTVIASTTDAAKAPTLHSGPGGSLIEYDPSKPAGQRISTAVAAPPDKTKPATEVRNGKTYQWDPSTGAWTEAAGLPSEEKPVAVSVNTTAPVLVGLDAQGNVVSREPNPNYRPPTPTLPAQSANAPMVPIEDPDKPGTITWVPNQGQVMAGDALQALAAQLSNTVVDPNHPLTMDQAKALIEAANQRLTAETQKAQAAAQQAGVARGAAGDILSAQSAGAQTGAGMLQQRQQTAQNLVQQGLGIATSAGGRYGNYSGGMLSPVPGLGQNLAQGAAGFATELGGGQAVYDTAIRMVQAADPNNQNPDRAAAVATLTQLMDRYKQASGQDHPAVAATQALQASQASGGMAGPQTLNPAAVTPEVFQAQYDPRLNPAAPQQPPNTLLNAGVAGTVPPGDPRRLGFSAPAREPMPWERSMNFNPYTPMPMQGFMAPSMVPMGGR